MSSLLHAMGGESETVLPFIRASSVPADLTQGVRSERMASESHQLDNAVAPKRWTGFADRELIERSLNGDRQALDELFARHARVGYWNALTILENPEDAEDALQDGLFSAFRNLRRFEGRAGFPTWLTRIVVNAALMRLRGRRAHQFLPMMDEAGRNGQRLIDMPRHPCSTAEDEVIQRELREMLARTIYELPERSRGVLLYYLSGCTLCKIAEMMGISVGTVKSLVYRARARVVTQLKSSYAHRHAILPEQVLKDRQGARVIQVSVGSKPLQSGLGRPETAHRGIQPCRDWAST